MPSNIHSARAKEEDQEAPFYLNASDSNKLTKRFILKVIFLIKHKVALFYKLKLHQ